MGIEPAQSILHFRAGMSADMVQRHYDGRRRYTHKERARQPTFELRCINNYIKTCLLKEAVADIVAQTPPQPGDVSRVHVLDLCCGHGSDVSKYANTKEITWVHFVDISPKNIDDTMDRVHRQQPGYRASFTVADVGMDKLLLPDNTFDIAVCHFALHYLFDQPRLRVGALLRTLAGCMRPGGRVIFTYPAENKVRTVTNALMHVCAPTFDARSNEPVRYKFHLVGAIDADEWVVRQRLLHRLMNEYLRIETITWAPLTELLRRFGETELSRIMQTETDLAKVTAATRECVDFYTSCVVKLTVR